MEHRKERLLGQIEKTNKSGGYAWAGQVAAQLEQLEGQIDSLQASIVSLESDIATIQADITLIKNILRL
jgi:peptidoglycan hydrolase CwlO-like protein